MDSKVTSHSTGDTQGMWCESAHGTLGIVVKSIAPQEYVCAYKKTGSGNHPKGCYALSFNENGELMIQFPATATTDYKIVKMADVEEFARRYL